MKRTLIAPTPLEPARAAGTRSRRARIDQGLRLVSGLLLLGSLACGQEFSLPPQPDPGRIPTAGTYNLEKIWTLPGPTDVATQGSYLYVIEEESRVAAYLTQPIQPQNPFFVGEFEGLIRPVRLAVGKRDSTFLFVADAGDMRIKRYHFTGGQPRDSFTDTLWNQFSGLAADNFLNVYVSDATRDTVYKYTFDGHRIRLVSDEGNGTGFVRAPNGLHFNGEHLIVADTEKNWVQRLRPDTTNIAAPGQPIGADFPLNMPLDVSADRLAEFIYVADTGSDRILKFLKTGGFVDSVYSPLKPETELEIPLEAPRYVAAEDSLVFVSDPENNRLIGLRLASGPI